MCLGLELGRKSVSMTIRTPLHAQILLCNRSDNSDEALELDDSSDSSDSSVEDGEPGISASRNVALCLD